MKSYESRGYDIFDFDGTGMLEIEKIDEMNVFDSDEDAVEQAIKDGIKIISIDELSSLMTEIELKTSSKDFYFYL